MMTVERLMKLRVVMVSPATSVRDALMAMAKAGIRHLPVVDGHGRLLGVVSQLDVARAMDLSQATVGARGDVRVREIMSAPAWRATPHMAADQAAAIMIEHKIGALPVVDPEGAVLGIITETDFVEVAREVLSGVRPELRAQG
jgi:CBS domain-containing protein